MARDFCGRVGRGPPSRDFCRWHCSEIDMRGFLSNPKLDGTVLEPLRNPAVFTQVQVVLGAVQWPNGADLAPDSMYDVVREHGVWVLD